MKKKEEGLVFPLKKKCVAMLAPSFIVDFDYPEIIFQLKKLGFDKVVELTFGAKMVNINYAEELKNSEKLVIASVCPGIIKLIQKKYPQYKKNLIKVDSPMVAMAKICKKTYPKHKTVFISPCNFKKIEAKKSKCVDFVIDYKRLLSLFEKHKINGSGKNMKFDKFYNDYTKIYPVVGGLSKTAHLKGVIKKNQIKAIDGIENVFKFLEKPNKKIKFLDVTFCSGSCIGGPCISSNLSLRKRKRKVLNYLKRAKREDIPDFKKGVIKRVKDIVFKSKKF